MISRSAYRSRYGLPCSVSTVAIDEPRTYLWQRICKLVRPGAATGEPSIDEVQRAVKVGRGTVQRIKEGEAATRLSSLTTIAQNLGLPVWQLMMPEDTEVQVLSPRALEVARVFDDLPAHRQRQVYLQVQLALNPDLDPLEAATRLQGGPDGPVEGPSLPPQQDQGTRLATARTARPGESAPPAWWPGPSRPR